MRRLDCKYLLLSLLLLTGCVSVEMGGGEDRVVSYVFTDARPAMTSQPTQLPATLIIQSLDGDPLANSLSIAYSRNPGERELYQLSRWNERPVSAMPRLLMQRLNSRGTYRSVAALGEGVGGDLGLGIGIESIYHDASINPGNVRLIVRADLIQRATRDLLARRNFSAQDDLK